MNIGIDCNSLTHSLKGVGNYTYHVLDRLIKKRSQDVFYLYSYRRHQFFKEYSNVVCIYPKDARFGGFIWGNFFCNEHLDKLDVFWGPAQLLPYAVRGRDIYKILTVHDLAYKRFASSLNVKTKVAFSFCCLPSIRNANHIFVVSEFSKSELTHFYGRYIRNKPVTITYNGVDEQIFTPVPQSSARKYIAKQYGLVGDFILSVCTIEPRKNLITLLEAVRLLRNEGKMYGKLCLVGEVGWKSTPLFNFIKDCQLERDLVLVGYVPTTELKYFYSACSLFVNPSIYEGFGIPNLEAFTCNAKLLVSDIPVFRELLGESAVYFEPQNSSELANKILACLEGSLVIKPSSRSYLWEEAVDVISGELDKRK